jgi:hypothetical protein
MNQNGIESENTDKTIIEHKPEPPKRSYTRREKKAPTFASVNELIEAREHEISAIQAEIEQLTAKRNELFFLESQEMGLINVISDPDKAKWLAGVVKESAHMKRQQ